MLAAIFAFLITTAMFAQSSTIQNNQDAKKENKNSSPQTLTNTQSDIQNNSNQPAKVVKRNKVIYRNGNKEKATQVRRTQTKKVK